MSANVVGGVRTTRTNRKSPPLIFPPHVPRCLTMIMGHRYDEHPQCSYGEGRLHFAVHVRMGDRREFQDANSRYFDLLEVIMEDISAEVLRKGMAKPLFHVFSETLAPCPSGAAGLFDEFPTWPVGVDKVRFGSVWFWFGLVLVWSGVVGFGLCRFCRLSVVKVEREREASFSRTHADENVKSVKQAPL